MNYKLVNSTASAIILGVPLLVMCFYFGTDVQSHCLNITLLIMALLLGWLLGILASPYTSTEHRDFTAYTKAISAFISGFVVAKADKAIEHIFDPQTLGDATVLFRLALFIAGFLLALVITFVYRRYA
jgi:hypothetical protein